MDWDVPEEGLPVILKGKSYNYDGFHPASALRIFYDLELLTINLLNRDKTSDWKIKSLNLSGELANISPPEIAFYPDISIQIHGILQIHHTIKGSITGNTFRNKIVADFEITDNQQISFKNYGGNKVGEDDWGRAFRNNLLNTVKFNILNNELIFRDSQDKPTIVFIRKYKPDKTGFGEKRRDLTEKDYICRRKTVPGCIELYLST